jgi:hypothetical protein
VLYLRVKTGEFSVLKVVAIDGETGINSHTKGARRVELASKSITRITKKENVRLDE